MSFVRKLFDRQTLARHNVVFSPKGRFTQIGAVENTRAYYDTVTITGVKSFLVPNVVATTLSITKTQRSTY